MGHGGDRRRTFPGGASPNAERSGSNRAEARVLAIGRLKANSLQPSDSSVWHVAARVSGADAKGLRRALIAVAGSDARELPPIPSLGFVLSENGSPVTSYKMTERPAPDAMSVVFLFPREAQAAEPFREGVVSCLKWKRTSDLWCILPYVESGDGNMPEAGRDPEAPAFVAVPETLRKALSEPAKRLECGDLWSSVWRGAKMDGGAPRGSRHILVFSSTEEQRLAGHGVVGKARNARVQIQAIATGPNRRMQDFCTEVGAPFRMVVRGRSRKTFAGCTWHCWPATKSPISR